MSNVRDQVEAYVKRVRELADHVRGNEQATKQSLIGPFFTMLGYDLTDPRECIPEFKTDFGRERSVKPIDWAFFNGGTASFFVEAKEVGKKLAGYDEQLADYFAKETAVKLGILTNGVNWRFYTDVVNSNVMDKEPFARWDVLTEEPPYDVITLLQKSSFNAELIRAYAQRQRAQSLLVAELSRLLEPAHEFTKLAIANVESRNLTQGVVESWKPIVAAALNEWARQRMLTEVLASRSVADGSGDGKGDAAKIETTEEELTAFEVVKNVLGPDRAIAYEDSVAYFKIHLAERRTWVFARLIFGKKASYLSVPMSIEDVAKLAPAVNTTHQSGWTSLLIDGPARLAELGDLLVAAYTSVRSAKAKGGEEG